jgi:hypothetical protein
VTIAALAVLALTDPKRRRTRHRRSPQMTAVRFLALAVALLPGLWLLVTLQSASLFIWLGAAALGGWFLTLLLPRIGEKSS